MALQIQINGSALKPVPSKSFDQLKTSLSSTFRPLLKLPMKIDVSKTMKNARVKILEAFVDSMFQFVDQPLLPSQSNFAAVEEIGEAVEVTSIQGEIPADFPEGVYVRNGSNPKFGGLKSAVSVFGKTSQIWVEGEGMVHGLFFKKENNGNWSISYKNKFVESESYKIERLRNKPTFLPTVEGDSLAVLAAPLLNMMRYGLPTKDYQSINVFVHAGKLYTTSENYPAQEIEIATLECLDSWDFNGDWNGPFTSHPKVAPGSGELVTMGVDAQKPYCVIGVISADGKKLLHKVDLKYKRSVLSHDIGVTQNYNVIIDHPLVVDITRVIKGGPLLKYDNEGNSRIGVMPRYGDADSVKWFEVEPNCTFHIINCFEDGDEVVVRGCRASAAIIPGPDWGEDKFDWFSRGFNFSENNSAEKGYLFHRVREWRLNMVTGLVNENFLSGTDFSMDFPIINGDFTGLKHNYGYTQLIDSMASSISGITKYGGLAKLYFEEQCSMLSEAYIIDAKKFESEPIAIITLPKRVPYGHHGTFIAMPYQA